jgi:hypothetical protein
MSLLVSFHTNVSSTMIYMHRLNRIGKGVWSPADALIQGLTASQLYQAVEKNICRYARTSMVRTAGRSQVYLVIWSVWSIWFVLFPDPEKPNARDRPYRPDRPNEQDRLADFFSILIMELCRSV